MRHPKYLAGALVACAVVGLSAAPSSSPRTVAEFFDAFTTEWMHANPRNLAMSMRYFSGPEQDVVDQQVSLDTPEFWHSMAQLAQKGLRELGTYDRARMTADERVSADLLRWQLEGAVEYDKHTGMIFPLEQYAGVNVNLTTTLTVAHPLNSEKDAVHYITRLGLVATRMDQAAALTTARAANHLIPPRFILRATITQMEQFVATPPKDNPFVATFDDRLAASKALSDPRRAELRAEAEEIVRSQVYPSWRRGIAVLQSLVSRSSDDAGLWQFKGGAELYAYYLRRLDGTLTPDHVHAIGLQRVGEIEAQMDRLLRQLGRTEGSVMDRIAQLKKEQAYPLTEDGRAQLLADADAMLRDALKRAVPQFDRIPRTALEVRPIPRFREANATTAYGLPAPDGSRPGVVLIPLRPERMTKFGLRSTMYHEGAPGHHFQAGLEIENTALPRFRRMFAFGNIPAFNEGWGLYAERLAAESGWYDDDPIGLLGQLDSELFRARRLVVDTGIHAKHWTRQQAIDYGIEPSEVERYVVVPGQACAYMIGELKLLELRDRAKKALGDKFDIRAYHNLVLGVGTVPLDQLEGIVDAYVSEVRSRK
jgi:uncharacterized protein (DUF885 family)